MEASTIALFGEAEKGEYQIPYFCNTLSQLVDNFGNPPAESRGLYFAVRALLCNCPLIFFRVQEEGFSAEDYLSGIQLLEWTCSCKQGFSKVSALFLPGVGSQEILKLAIPFCHAHHSILVMTEPDLYDYLTIHF